MIALGICFGENLCYEKSRCISTSLDDRSGFNILFITLLYYKLLRNKMIVNRDVRNVRSRRKVIFQ